MKRFGQVARLKPEKIGEYKTLHAAVWPQVLKTIGACKIRNYSIHLRDDLVFARFDYLGDDFEADMQKMADDPVTQAWWKLTKPCFLGHEQADYYQDMEEIFYYDQQ